MRKLSQLVSCQETNIIKYFSAWQEAGLMPDLEGKALDRAGRTCNGLAHEGDDVVLVGQWQTPAAPEQADGGPHHPAPLLVPSESEHLAASHVVHRYQICSATGIELKRRHLSPSPNIAI